MTWTFLTNAVDKTPSTTGQWVDVDLSANVPPGTKTALLKIVNTSSSIDYNYGIRPKGSSVTRVLKLLNRTNCIAVVKLDVNYVFQAYIESTLLKIYLWGYSDEDLCFINPYDKSTNTTGQWVDVANDELPSGAKGAIYERVNLEPAANILGLRPKGSTTDLSSSSRINYIGHDWAMVGVDVNRYAQQYAATTNLDLYLWGHAGSDFTPFVNPVDITPTTTGAWTTVNLSSYIPEGAYGVLLAFHNTSSTTMYEGDCRKTGSTDDFWRKIRALFVKWYAVGVDSNRNVDIYIESTSVKVYLWGYFKPPITYVNISDYASGLETFSGRASLLLADFSTGFETWVTGISISAADFASGFEALSITQASLLSIADFATGLEVARSIAMLATMDAALGSEVCSRTVPESISLGDLAHGLEAVSAFALRPRPPAFRGRPAYLLRPAVEAPSIGFYCREISVPPGSAVEEEVWIEGDVIKSVSVVFPPGPHGLLKVAIFYGEKKIYPSEEKSWISGDNERIETHAVWRLPETPCRLIVRAENHDTLYPHMFFLRLETGWIESITLKPSAEGGLFEIGI
ncbi:hypothetical protein [Thermosphaera sp.]